MADAVSLRFPDGSERDYAAAATGAEIAGGISKSLLKKAVAYALDGELRDLADPVGRSGAIEIVLRDDKRALELIRHDAAHVMAEAVQELWPGTQVTIGPVIENGFYYDFARDTPFTPDDLPVIEKKMAEIIRRNAPFAKTVWSRDKAREVFAAKGENYKVELIDAIPAEQDLKIYSQGEWFDLCRGPHMASTGQIGDAFKLLKVAGAYWRGDSNNPMLTRIYGTAWATQDELKAYLHMLEEAEKRDHRRLGREMDLYHFQDDAPGTVFWHPKGWALYQTLVSYVRRRQEAEGYQEVNAPQLLERSLWETSGHWEKYHENMFVTETEDERVFALKPMNCPGHVQIFKHGLKSYRDLPLKLAELGMVHRYEPSGALHGLMRVRAFTQDDAHVFCTEAQIAAESLKINELILSIYRDFGFDHVLVKLSTRPDQRVGSDEMWDRAEASMREVLTIIEQEGGGQVTTGIAEGEGAFYGPKYEYTLRDAIGRQWQVGTNQVDFNLPGRFGAFYIDRDSEKKTPVMLHRAMLGSVERFIGILLENCAGHLPLWLSPVQVVVATITSDADDYAMEVAHLLKKAGLKVETDLRNEKINYKVREHSVAKIPVMLVCGKREAEERTVNIRRLGSRDQTSATLDAALAALVDEAVPPDLRRIRQDDAAAA
ncbi:MAG: threonine--tRNA ligase [Aurantimonas endophytica]|uniref:threonine--tRNA ligase n=1 Tax=Aurantimonas endophytica TaxID=1522175 RepID=UPI003002E140